MPQNTIKLDAWKRFLVIESRNAVGANAQESALLNKSGTWVVLANLTAKTQKSCGLILAALIPGRTCFRRICVSKVWVKKSRRTDLVVFTGSETFKLILLLRCRCP